MNCNVDVLERARRKKGKRSGGRGHCERDETDVAGVVGDRFEEPGERVSSVFRDRDEKRVLGVDSVDFMELREDSPAGRRILLGCEVEAGELDCPD